MSLIYNICFLVCMNKKVKQYVTSNYFKSFNSDNIFIRLVCLLFILAALIICLYLLYRAISNALYMYRLKTDFYKLQDMGLNVKNYKVLYFEEIKKKYLIKKIKLKKENTKSEFKNKNAIGFIPKDHIVLDFDTKDGVESANFLIDKIPKDTVCEKTPNGYHYYFENDTGKTIHTYVKIKINNIKHAVDILGSDAIVTMSPSRIDGKDYYWINSIFTHKSAKLSENMWILDLIQNQKPFFRDFEGVDISINVKNMFIIIDNLLIESRFRFIFETLKDYTKKIKLLNGVVYNYDDNYYFMSRNSFYKYKNKKKIIEKLKDVIVELKPSCIIDISLIYSNYLKPASIIQTSSTIISNKFKNYKYDNTFPNYIETNNLYKKTKYFIKDTVTINEYDTVKVNDPFINQENKNQVENIKNNKLLFGSESIYITILLSNYFDIPNICLGIVNEHNKDNSNKLSDKTNDYIVNSFFSMF